MTRQQKRLGLVLAILFIAGLAVALTLTALQQSVAYFYTPSELAGLPAPPVNTIRLGGLVETGSISYNDGAATDSVNVSFVVTDGGASNIVRYHGVLPDLFREGQGVVVEGRVGAGGTIEAATVLAKHDETYMPKELADALKEQGRWQETN